MLTFTLKYNKNLSTKVNIKDKEANYVNIRYFGIAN